MIYTSDSGQGKRPPAPGETNVLLGDCPAVQCSKLLRAMTLWGLSPLQKHHCSHSAPADRAPLSRAMWVSVFYIRKRLEIRPISLAAKKLT